MTKPKSFRIFLVLFSFVLMGAGFLTISKNATVTLADTTTQTAITNSTPEYFSVEDSSSSSLISSNILMVSSGTTLTLSFETNGTGTTYGIYDYVYYPDLTDTTEFYFFADFHVDLSINGVDQSTMISSKNFVTETGYYFKNQVDTSSQQGTSYALKYLETFEMQFDTTNSDDNSTDTVSLYQNNTLVEGLYTVNISYLLYHCTDGGDSSEEQEFSDESLSFTYSFYVVSGSSYFSGNNKPQIAYGQFDTDISVSSTSDENAYVLYSNYTAYKDGNVTDANKVPYIEYDPTRFDLSVSKNLNSTISEFTLTYDTTGQLVCSDDEIIFSFDETTSTARLYFVDLGVYTVTFSAINVIEYTTDSDGNTTIQKLALDGITENARNVVVYMFGYQAGYTNYDEEKDASTNSRPISELKTVDTTTDTYSFTDSADITSSFVNSLSSYDPTQASASFTWYNILNYVNSSSVSPVTTNQKPIRLTTNVTLNTSLSYVFTTYKMTGYEESSYTLNGETLYQKHFTGTTDSTDATYIYILAYTYNNYYSSENLLAATQTFYQIFYFQINNSNPTITVETYAEDSADAQTVLSGNYYNTSIVLTDDTKEDTPYCKDVTVQIYAQDYTSSSTAYYSQFGGTSGIALSSVVGNLTGYYTYSSSDPYTLQLDANAHYTIRLYYTSDLTSGETTTAISNTSGFISSMTFTIDKIAISNVTARSVTDSTSSTYQILSSFEYVTNQSFVLSWSEKASNATTSAYYRYFPLVDATYYSDTQSYTSQLINTMLNRSGVDYIAVNKILDLSGDNEKTSSWLPLSGGNTISYSEFSTVSGDYILSDAGLYIFQIEDEAGNVTYSIYLLDNSDPLFVIQDTTQTYGYSIASGTQYLTNKSVLYWGNYKAIYVNGLSTYGLFSSSSEITTADLTDTDEIYSDRSGTENLELFEIFKTFYSNNMQYINNSADAATDVDSTFQTNSYKSVYVTIAIEDVSYYSSTSTGGSYTKQEDTDHSFEFDVDTYTDSFTYTVLIRDTGNTKQDYSNTTESRQYTYYYSAKQTVVISFDSSELRIGYYPNNSDTLETFVSYNTQTTKDESTNKNVTKTDYFHPTSLEKEFVLSFIPTVVTTSTDQTTGLETQTTIQVASVEISYYAYTTNTVAHANGYTYYSETLSTTQQTISVYTYDGTNSSTTAIETSINVSSNMTKAGKYVITRTYDTSGTFSVNDKDSESLTLVLYVDRFGVVSTAESITNTSHTESLVGGDIFVSMFDSGVDSSIVVTFPNSPYGNTDGQTLYSSSNLTTNKLPVNVYIPVYKFTQYVAQVDDSDGYHFEVVKDESLNEYYDSTTIKEYVLYAQIYKDSSSNPNNMVAHSSVSVTSAISDYENNSGFLTFYTDTAETQVLTELTSAGEYYVVIYQGYFGEEQSGENAFESSFTFKFVIENANPDFTATTTSGGTLNSELDSSVEVYYTNQQDALLTWDAATDSYSVEIDLANIVVQAVSADGSSKLLSTAVSENTLDSDSKTYTYVLSWKNDSTNKNKYDPTKSDSGTYYNATLDLATLGTDENGSTIGVYEDGGYVVITMQFCNHSSYYTTVTKKIMVDLVAPTTNIDSLVETTLAAKDTVTLTSLTESALRVYKTASYATTTKDSGKASYNLTNFSTEGYFSNYTYIVTTSYISTLQSLAHSEMLTTTSGTIQYLTYIKEISSTNEASENPPSTFNEYSVVGGSGSSYFTDLNAGSYYEVAECDKAGNMTIYTIYVMNKSDSDTTILTATATEANDDGEYDVKSYTSDDFLAAETDGTTKTFYLRTGYELSSINYFGDTWAIMRLTTYSANNATTTKTLVMSPTLDGYVYQFVGSSVTVLSISDLIDSTYSTSNKHILEIYDRSTGVWDTLYISVYNTTLSASLSTSSSLEYITFTQPTDNTLTSNTARSTVFLQKLAIVITYSGSNSSVVLYGGEIDDELQYVTNLTGLAKNWTSSDDGKVTVNTSTSGQITFSLDLSSYGLGTKVKYYYVDNFGRTYTETHIYGETVITQPVSTEEDVLYAHLNSDGEEVYISTNTMSYTYNAAKNTVVVMNTATNVRSDETSYTFSDTGFSVSVTSTSNSDGTTTTTVKATATTDSDGLKTGTYDLSFAFLVFDAESYSEGSTSVSDCDKEVLFRLYDKLPIAASSSSVSAGEFKIVDSNSTDITAEIVGTAESSSDGYYSEVRVIYSLDSTISIPVVISLSTDGGDTWETLTSGTRLRNDTNEMVTYYLKIWYQEDYLQNTYGSTYSYVFQSVPDEQIFSFNLSSLTATYWVEKTVDGVTEVVSKSDSAFEYDGAKYSNHYIVNMEYSSSAANENSSVRIRVNQEYDLSVTSVATYTQGTVTSELLKVASSESSKYSLTFNVVISYIPESDNFVTGFYLSGLSGTLEDTNYISSTSASVYVTEEYTSLNTLKLQWTKYYGIKENTVGISITKEDGSVLNPTLYSTTDSNGNAFYYTYLTYSGKYSITLKDEAGNVQKFNSGNRGQSEIFTLTFLKDVPFNVTYTKLGAEESTTALPTTQSVFNSDVTLTIPSAIISLLYGYPSIAVTLNGAEYDGGFSTDSTEFTFTQAGYYEVTFSATLATGETLREETFQFSIVSADEYKISYVLNKYSNYYIDSVYKDGSDVTEQFLATLSGDTIVVNNTEKLASLSLSYLDEKTGSGVYTITVDSNNSLYPDSDSVMNSWTYQITINQGTAPLKISISEGASTTSNITITYNAENMFAELGDSTLRIMKLSDSGSLSQSGDTVTINSESTGEGTITITGTGTFFVQVLSSSGNLLFSYKVTKNEAMNAATIIIIIVAIVLTIVVMFIVFRLRKRISVK